MDSAPSPKGLLIEGVECAGKSTLIKKIRDDVVPWDCKFLAHQPGQQFERFMYEYMVGNKIIFNRGHLSEVVYSRLWGRESPFTSHELQVLNDYVRRNLILVLCDADLDTLVRRYQERKFNQKAAAKELSDIQRLFREQIAEQGIEFLEYVSSDDGALTAIAEQVKSRLPR